MTSTIYLVQFDHAALSWATADRAKAEADFQRLAADHACWLVQVRKTVNTVLAISLKGRPQ